MEISAEMSEFEKIFFQFIREKFRYHGLYHGVYARGRPQLIRRKRLMQPAVFLIYRSQMPKA